MTITDADREAAAQAIAVQSPMNLRDAVLRGDYDKSEAVKMFARHREQAVQEAVAGIVAWLREQDGHGEWQEAADAIDVEFLARTGEQS